MGPVQPPCSFPASSLWLPCSFLTHSCVPKCIIARHPLRVTRHWNPTSASPSQSDALLGAKNPAHIHIRPATRHLYAIFATLLISFWARAASLRTPCSLLTHLISSQSASPSKGDALLCIKKSDTYTACLSTPIWHFGNPFD